MACPPGVHPPWSGRGGCRAATLWVQKNTLGMKTLVRRDFKTKPKTLRRANARCSPPSFVQFKATQPFHHPSWMEGPWVVLRKNQAKCSLWKSANPNSSTPLPTPPASETNQLLWGQTLPPPGGWGWQKSIPPPPTFCLCPPAPPTTPGRPMHLKTLE